MFLTILSVKQWNGKNYIMKNYIIFYLTEIIGEEITIWDDTSTNNSSSEMNSSVFYQIMRLILQIQMTQMIYHFFFYKTFEITLRDDLQQRIFTALCTIIPFFLLRENQKHPDKIRVNLTTSPNNTRSVQDVADNAKRNSSKTENSHCSFPERFVKLSKDLPLQYLPADIILIG